MGKYMKKPQLSADVTLMELSASSTLGVRTRAKTLALQRLNSPPSHPSSSSYLQLRSRRLEIPPPLLKITKKPQEDKHRSETEKLKCNDSSGVSQSCGGGFVEKRELLDLQSGDEDLGVEASFGENCLDLESSGRGTRESTPCSLIRDSETVKTPGSTTRHTSSSRANRRATTNILRNIPTTHAMEEFFSCAEQEQQRLFIEKYNFDVANDLPLSGRYEWVQVVP